MKTPSDAYQRGLKAGRIARPDIRRTMEDMSLWLRKAYPAAAHLDHMQEILKLDRERIGSEPSLSRYPETRGLADLVSAERRGFQEGCGCGDLETAYHYTWHFYTRVRLNTRYIGSPAGTNNCTAVFIRDSKEGGPLYGRNWDVPHSAHADLQPPRRGPDGKRRLFCKGVSCATMCDEEPREIFPVDVWGVMPDDCRKLPDVVEFLRRYTEFWGGQNGVLVDEDLDSVAYEKSNCRMALRYSEDGTAAVTGCAQLIPEMERFRDQCHRRSLDLRRFDENSADWLYWKAAESRYRRLLKLVKEANQGGAMLEDMTTIVTDHAVPHPDHVCVSGESCHPDFAQGSMEWTMRSRAAVLHGPNRRTLFWRVEGRQACYENPPFLILGDGVKMKPEWQKGTRPPPPRPASEPDDLQEDYRQYEFDEVRVFSD